MTLDGARVLVTGASGLIGSHVLPLLERRTEVFAVSRFPRDDDGRVEWLARDLAVPGATSEVIMSIAPDVVIHLAGAVRGDRSLEAVAPTFGANLLMTVELLEAATRAGCRRIVVSGSPLEEPRSGGTDAVPPSPYGASRWAGSAYARMFHALFGTPAVIIRPSYTYGPGQEGSKLIPLVMMALLAGESPELSSGERMLDCVYAADVAQAYVAAAVTPDIEGLTLDLASGEERSVRDIVRLLVDMLGPTPGHPRFGVIPERPCEQKVRLDVAPAAQALGWRATTSLEDGMRRTVAWYRERLAAQAA